MEYKDYYEILGVPRDADEKAIKRAFRSLARKHHPDLNPDDPEAEKRFKDINEAHEVLGDAEKRAKYDSFGKEWRRYQTAGAPGGFDWNQWSAGQAPGGTQYTYASAEDLESLFGGGGGFSDFFETLFGRPRAPAGGGRRVSPRRGHDLEHPVAVTLEEAFHGTQRRIQKDGRMLEVSIPAGVRTGSKVRMRGEGQAGAAGGPAGDLMLRIEVLPHPRFERRGDDLHTTVEVPVAIAALGGEVPVETLTGPVQLRVPPETQNGRRIRLRGKGLPAVSDPDRRGDLYATVSLRLPTGLSAEERQLFERLRALRAED
jgi:curved DNA-binding protein